MRFLFVDQITRIDGAAIKGRTAFPPDHAMQYAGPQGQPQIAPGIISEAIGQLVSWLEIRNNDFTGRPVFLFADRIEILGTVRPGSTVELEGTIERSDADSFVFSGAAYVGGSVVHRVQSCSGYNMPLAKMEDPEIARQRFAALTNGGLTLDDDRLKFDFDLLSSSDIRIEPGKSACMRLALPASAGFYRDHFPRFPVTPIVIINEMIGLATSKCLDTHGRILLPRQVSAVKIKSFLAPEEICEVSVQITETLAPSAACPGGGVSAIAEISKNGKKILRGRYQYEIVE